MGNLTGPTFRRCGCCFFVGITGSGRLVMSHGRGKMLLGQDGGGIAISRKTLGASGFLRIRAIFANGTLFRICEPYKSSGEVRPF